MVRAELERRYASAVCGFRFTTDVMGNEHFELYAPDMQPWLSAADANPAGITTAWLLRKFGVEQMMEMFAASIDATVPGIPHIEKPRIVAEIEARIVELELAEVSYIDQAISAGLDVQYRPHTSPLALLALQPVRSQQPMLEAAE